MLGTPIRVSQSFRPMISERIRKRAVASAFLSPLYRRNGFDPHAFRHATAVLAVARFSFQRCLHSSSRAVRIWETGFCLHLWFPCSGPGDRSPTCPVPPTLAAVWRCVPCVVRARWFSSPLVLMVWALVMALSMADGGL